MDRLFVGIIGVPLGFLIIIYRYQLKQFTGNVGFAEQYLGAGGTYNLFVLIGLLVSVLSMMYAFGTVQDFYNGYLGLFFGRSA